MSSSQADEPDAQAFHRKIGFRDAGALIDLQPLQSVTEVFFVKNIETSDTAWQFHQLDDLPYKIRKLS